MSLISSIRSNYSYAAGLRSYLLEPMTLEQARADAKRGLAARTQSFLETMERRVYRNPRSPYFKLLEHAGIELESVRNLVHEAGLEGAPGRLYDLGVYLTQEEFKGREPVRRGTLEFTTSISDLSSRNTRPVMEYQSSGSTGEATRFQYDFQGLTGWMGSHILSHLALREHRPMAAWEVGSLTRPLFLAKASSPLEKYFSTNGFRWTAEGFRTAVLNNYTLLVARLSGRPTPRPEYATRAHPLPVVRWLAEKVEEGTPALFRCSASLGARTCLFAAEHGFDISGTLFLLQGEPYTPAKAEVLKSVGAEARVTYSTVEASIGQPCGNPAELDEVHLGADRIALIQREKVTTSGAVVPGLVITSVSPDPSRLLLNLETGDYADVSRRDCGCFFAELGFETHLSGIRSYEKLTSEGITFMGSRLYQIVEEVLPAAFGGGPGNYQLIEAEEGGLPRVSVVVSPRVGPLDDAAVLATVLHGIKLTHPLGGELMTEQWRQADILRVVRREPYETRTQKVPPLHVVHGTRAQEGNAVR